MKAFLSNLFSCVGCAGRNFNSNVQAVTHVDLSRYEGVWYEIASYPQFYEKGCTHVKATYTLLDDCVEVVNECLRKGKPYQVKGKACILPNTGNAKLKVRFQWPFKADYWIVELSEDYSWAVVSDPHQKTLWILSRTPQMDDILYEWLLDKLARKGFTISNLVLMDQS